MREKQQSGRRFHSLNAEVDRIYDKMVTETAAAIQRHVMRSGPILAEHALADAVAQAAIEVMDELYEVLAKKPRGKSE